MVQPRLAVLIDAENVSAKYWPSLRPKLDGIGMISVCRLFGDFSQGRHAKWIKVAQQEALQVVMQLSGHNASDIAITISAMDLLHTARIEAFCLATSDGDFTPLVQRLRSAGVKVHGFGDDKAPASLRKAYTTFTNLAETPKPVAVPKAA